MTQANHTPGPWTLEQYGSGCLAIIAGCRNIGNTSIARTPLDAPVALANAILMAAAPDLLATLRAVLCNEGRDTDGHSVNCASQPTWASGCDKVGPCDCCFGQARTVIEKAEGKP